MDRPSKLDEGPKKRERMSSVYVKWVAIGVGVFMVMVGGLLLLWGFSYQAAVGEPTDLEGDELKGGPILIPIGAASIAFGALWLFYGVKGFKRPGEEVGMKRCPHCGKTIEEDLNFCYHCATTFTTPEEVERDMRSVEEKEEEDPEESTSDDGPSKGQMARMRRQQERRPSSDNELDLQERRAAPLKGLEGGGKGQ